MKKKLKALSDYLYKAGLKNDSSHTLKLAVTIPRTVGHSPCQTLIQLHQHYRGLMGKKLTDMQRALYYSEDETVNQCVIDSKKLITEEAENRGVIVQEIIKELRDLKDGKVELGKPRYPLIEKTPAAFKEDGDYEDYDDETEDNQEVASISSGNISKLMDPGVLVDNIVGTTFRNLIDKK